VESRDLANLTVIAIVLCGGQQGGPVLDALNVIVNELNLITVLGSPLCARWKFKVQRAKHDREIGQTLFNLLSALRGTCAKALELPDVIVDVNDCQNDEIIIRLQIFADNYVKTMNSAKSRFPEVCLCRRLDVVHEDGQSIAKQPDRGGDKTLCAHSSVLAGTAGPVMDIVLSR
jgi:hypothetical protein